MELVSRDDNGESSVTRFCNCYRALSLKEAILETNQVSDFSDHYVLGDQLGWGKFGIIRACSDKLTGEVLACKSIAKERLVTPDDVRSVKLEIEIMIKLSGHPNVVNLKAVYEDNDYVHLLMELCAGGELFHQIEKYRRFSEYDARILFRQLMEVVMYCHDNGIIHRDLKPENILLVSNSASSPIKLADFGLATHIRYGKNLHGTVGSPFYIAPEVLSGGYNQAADVWSAGVILYILLSGIPPFWGKTKSRIFNAVRVADLRFHPELWDHISESAKELITKMLCTDPSKRLTATEVLAHSWMNNDFDLETENRIIQDSCTTTSQLREVDNNCSFSIPSSSMARNQDYSFNDDGSPPSCSKLDNSPVFTCKSSFSSVPINQSPIPCSLSGVFSFDSDNNELCAPEFASPVSSMPSFSFFSPITVVVDQSNNNESSFKAKTSMLDKDSSSLPKVFLFPDPSSQQQEQQLIIGHKLREIEHRTTEFRRGGVGLGSSSSSSNSSKMSSSKRRNHTIGLGELDQQLDLVVTSESVIRWASCTHVSGTTSLRSSLVC